jgi:hypothetical protein
MTDAQKVRLWLWLFTAYALALSLAELLLYLAVRCP